MGVTIPSNETVVRKINPSRRPWVADKETIWRVITHPLYRKARATLQSFQTLSRTLRANAPGLLDLQVEMVSYLIALQSSQRKLEVHAGDVSKTEDFRNEARLRLAAVRRLHRVVREIGDGIAWRLFSYDRVALYQLARKPQTGHLEATSAQIEINEASVHADAGTLVLLNDLTNVVRYADLTLFREAAIEFIKSKGGKGSRESGHTTKQRKKLEGVAEFINTQRRRTPVGTEGLLRVKTDPKTHLSSVQELVSLARRQGNAHVRLSECVAVDVFDVELAAASVTGRRSLLGVRHNPFSESKKAIGSDSLHAFHQFTANRAPYSIFPWPDDDCADLLSGRIWIVGYFNWSKIERLLKRRGLTVSELEPEAVRQFFGLPIQDQRRLNLGLTVRRTNSSRTLTISFIEFARLAYEFLQEESFVDAIEEVLEIGVPPGARYFIAFENEDLIWD